MQRVIAHCYNRALERRGKVDTFSVVKFCSKTNGKDGALYAFCLTVAAPETELKITSLGATANLFGKPIKPVTLLGPTTPTLAWRQTPDALVIASPSKTPCATAIVFKIE